MLYNKMYVNVCKIYSHNARKYTCTVLLFLILFPFFNGNCPAQAIFQRLSQEKQKIHTG